MSLIMNLIIYTIVVACVTCIIVLIGTLLYSAPYIIWATNQYEKIGKAFVALDMKPTLKNATILYTSPFTGKKPPIF